MFVYMHVVMLSDGVNTNGYSLESEITVHFGTINLCESGALKWLQDNPCKGNGFAGGGHGSLLSAYPS